jgi:glycosyltransferase involved in cell wall biosynthesis
VTRIIHIQYSTGSAGSAACRLSKAFNEAGLESGILSLHSENPESTSIKSLGKKSKLISRLEYKLNRFLTRNTNSQFGLFTYPVLGTNIANLDQVKKADIIYLHWVLGGMLNLKSIGNLAKLGKPVIFFMHDMWDITGGCHHSFSCEKYKVHCEECQVFKNKKKHDLSWFGFNAKAKLYSKYNNLFFVSPSKWLYNCARQSYLTKNKSVFYIPNVIDENVYKSVGKDLARRIFDIDINESVIAFGAVSVDSPYKGWAYLKDALKILSKDPNLSKISVLLFGRGVNEEILNSIPFKTRFLGYLKDEYSMILTYNAADVFVAPSLADNQPTTVMESLCCNTPVVGFDVGGIPDMIRHRENGYLAKYKSAEDLAEGIRFCLEKNLHGSILPDFKKDLVVGKHKDLINDVLVK